MKHLSSLLAFVLVFTAGCRAAVGYTRHIPIRNSRDLIRAQPDWRLSAASTNNQELVKFQPLLASYSSLIKKMVALAMLTSSTMLCNPSSSIAATETKEYSNARYQTRLQYPAGWVPATGAISGERPIDAFVDPADADTSVAIVFTPIPADYNRLTSFGGKDSLRSFLLPGGDGVVTNVIKEKVAGETYTLEYVVNAPDKPVRHVISIFALKPQEAVIGINMQTKESTYDSNKEGFETIVSSFKYDL